MDDLQPVELAPDHQHVLEAMDPTAPILSVRDLTVEFKTDDGLLRAVDKASFDVHHNETLGIVGESGSGKSVTSMAILGLLPESANITGSIEFRGTQLLGMPEKKKEKL